MQDTNEAGHVAHLQHPHVRFHDGGRGSLTKAEELQLDEQALAQVARPHPGRIEGLNQAEGFLGILAMDLGIEIHGHADLVEGGGHDFPAGAVVGGLAGGVVGPQITVVVEVLDDAFTQIPHHAGRTVMSQLGEEVVAQIDGGGQAVLDRILGVGIALGHVAHADVVDHVFEELVDIAVLQAGLLGQRFGQSLERGLGAGRLPRHFAHLECGPRSEIGVELGLGPHRTVAAIGIGLGSGAGGLVIGDLLEQRVLAHLLIDDVREFEGGKGQQLDGLLHGRGQNEPLRQLGRERETLLQCHG